MEQGQGRGLEEGFKGSNGICEMFFLLHEIFLRMLILFWFWIVSYPV